MINELQNDPIDFSITIWSSRLDVEQRLDFGEKLSQYDAVIWSIPGVMTWKSNSVVLQRSNSDWPKHSNKQEILFGPLVSSSFVRWLTQTHRLRGKWIQNTPISSGGELKSRSQACFSKIPGRSWTKLETPTQGRSARITDTLTGSGHLFISEVTVQSTGLPVLWAPLAPEVVSSFWILSAYKTSWILLVILTWWCFVLFKIDGLNWPWPFYVFWNLVEKIVKH